MAVVMNLPSKRVQFIAHPADYVHVADIEKELAVLWSQFNQDISGGQVVMRACMSNLVIYCDNPEEAQIAGSEIGTIVDIHPARVLVLTANGYPPEDALNAHISIYYDTLPDGWQVCGERIDIVSSSQSALRLPSVIRSLLIGDLPTALWWASRKPPLDAGDVFIHLAEQVNQIIYDNIGWTNPAKHVADMTRWVAGQQDSKVFYNLAWRRISYWRKLISQVLDPQVTEGALTAIHTLEIEHGPHALPMTWLLVGWLACQLGWTPVDGKRLSPSELIWRFEKERREIKINARRLAEGEPIIYRLYIDWSQPEKTGRVCFQRLDQERIGIVGKLSTIAAARILLADAPPRSNLVASQLAHRSRDKLFENALKVSNRMTAVFQS
jgi:hypothetical protein